MAEDEDDLLIRRYMKGDQRAFEILYARYRTRLYGYIIRSCGDQDDTHEMYQEVWLKVIASLANYQPRGKFRQWLITCAHNVIVDYYRKAGREIGEASQEQDGGDGSPEQMETKGRIESALSSLPFEQRQAVYLRQQLSCSVADIAEIQGCTKEAAKSRLRYAYKKLQTELEDLMV